MAPQRRIRKRRFARDWSIPAKRQRIGVDSVPSAKFMEAFAFKTAPANPATGIQKANPRPTYTAKMNSFEKAVMKVVNRKTEQKYKQTTTNTVGNCWVINSASVLGTPGATPGTATPGLYGQWVPYPDRGDDYTDRDGRSIRMRGIQLKGNAACYSANAYEGAQVTFYLVEITQTGDLADTNPQDWLGTVWNVDVNGEYSSSCLRVREKMDQCKILAQQTLKLFPGAESTAEVNLYANLKDTEVNFIGSSGSNFETRAYFLYGMINGRVSNTATIAQPKVTFSGSIRVSFIDN